MGGEGWFRRAFCANERWEVDFRGSGPLRASLVFDPPKIDWLQSGILLPADPLQFAGLAQR